ncbi:hypothetical protein NP493_21g02025 [Ridgeia piscesae]|uniref:PH domain-containing protein n=1 Tax=Ridgeia piscesae TaxID=27915 RepID=A0AAD9PE25_RIDPI|nr:hypothetical protein NP493_21g02025 [Ridgeia piscesae]
MAACIKQGSLHVLISGVWKTKKWQKKFYVLRGFTDTATARLECHTSEEDFQSDKGAEYTYSFDEIADIRYREAPGASPEHKHTCEIGCKRKVIVFSAPSSGEMQEWVMAMMALKFETDERKKQPTANVPRQNDIYEPLGVASRLTVPVKIEPTDASRRCRLDEAEYILHVCRAELVLMDPRSKEMKQQWFYRYIRTYTNTPDVFSFECGRRCNSGEGLFSFSTPTAADLAVEVQAAVDALQSSDPSGVESKYTSMTKQATTDTATTTSARPSESPRVSYVNVPEVKETMTGSQTSPGRCMRVHCRYTAV